MSGSHPIRVIAIASGKGGVGKTMVSANLATTLALRRKKVLIFDADIGLANVQLALGVRAKYNLRHVISGEKTLNEILVKVSENLTLVPGANGFLNMATLSSTELSNIIHSFSEITEDIDYMIVDAAAGISDSVMVFLAACQERYIVINDDPSSIVDAYGTIKVMMKNYELNQIYLIPNKVQSQKEGEALFQRVNAVTEKCLSRTIKYLYSITLDEMVEQSLKASKPIVSFAPTSSAAHDFRRLSEKIIDLEVETKITGGIQFFMERLPSQPA